MRCDECGRESNDTMEMTVARLTNEVELSKRVVTAHRKLCDERAAKIKELEAALAEAEARHSFLRKAWFEQIIDHIVICENSKLAVNCSDSFPGGHCDCENISESEFTDFWQAFDDAKEAGDEEYGPLLWCARKRGVSICSGIWNKISAPLAMLFTLAARREKGGAK